MSSYKARFVSALKYTEKLGLDPGEKPVPWRGKISLKKARDVLLLSREVLDAAGMRQSSDLAMNCVAVHLKLQSAIYHYLKMKTYITIGDIFWSDYVYCEMSHEAIEKELNNPMLGEPIKSHVWLTLQDGSILDCTGEAHLDLIFGREEHPLEQCLTFIPPDKNIEDGYRRPFLVGPEFLVKAGVFTNPNA
ncbi:hypothetical protein IAI53_08365 [Thauera sp. CAU 1555]|uniref:Uncharacterized protein n=1 Tax=Thauera sedimentorum TaxID=2767595 RepID=A0ABR9B964_9RHOO|nr:hypothetical protein [Thauera sedimentorum]MBC9071974.1 hypothetical protein [Thauera sedimentorum]MBD8502893.1 hypothetical protein [Thauera sedimentorum]